MPTVIMPKMGDAMEEGTLLRWLKQAGEDVTAGDPIAEIETDKVTLEIEATDSGKLSRLLVDEGAVVPIGATIALIGEDAGEPEAPAANAEPEAPAPAPEPVAAAAEAPAAPAPAPAAPATGNGHAPAPVAAPVAATAAPAPAPNGTANGERLRASPLVKRLAAEHGIDLAQITGRGPGGRIVKDDIQPFLTGAQPTQTAAPAPAMAAPTPSAEPAAAPVPAEAPAPAAAPAAPRAGVTTRELSRIKRTTGKRMLESVTTQPHFFVTVVVDMDAAVAFREQINQQITDDASKVSFNDLVVKAAALALRDFPNLNSSLAGDTQSLYNSIDVNVAVALPDGLIAPFVPGADEKSLGAIARLTKDLIGRARNGGLQPNEYQGGGFTISNMGMFDVDEFISIINPPQAAILAVGSIAKVPVVRGDEIAIGQQMKLTMSADHRVTDGAEVARFLQSVRKYLENPMLLALS